MITNWKREYEIKNFAGDEHDHIAGWLTERGAEGWCLEQYLYVHERVLRRSPDEPGIWTVVISRRLGPYDKDLEGLKK
jgi:hypothetical protein